MARIVTVYSDVRDPFRPVEMADIRWLKISQALARCGHTVDMASGERSAVGSVPPPVAMGDNLRRVSLRDLRWSDYDVVKTLFNVGFETLESHGGADHPFIISKLGSVVDARDREGIYFYGHTRERLYAIQERINWRSAYVTLLSRPARDLWRELFGSDDNVLLVPGAADRTIPPPAADPFPDDHAIRVLFAGHVYFDDAQPEANVVLSQKLNELGRRLPAGFRLYMIGSGNLSRIDSGAVTHLGAVRHDEAWNYLQHAHVGVVVAAGPFMHNNESSKIYHYLRAGLPVVSEAGFPNDHVIDEAGLGFVVKNGDLELMTERIEAAAGGEWDREAAVRYILANHTWDKRVEVYDRLLRGRFG